MIIFLFLGLCVGFGLGLFSVCWFCVVAWLFSCFHVMTPLTGHFTSSCNCTEFLAQAAATRIYVPHGKKKKIILLLCIYIYIRIIY